MAEDLSALGLFSNFYKPITRPPGQFDDMNKLLARTPETASFERAVILLERHTSHLSRPDEQSDSNHNSELSQWRLIMGSCPFLELPQELRDIILSYALGEYQHRTDGDTPYCGSRVKRLQFGNKRWEWEIPYPSSAPLSAYLSLMMCNRHLYHELQEYLDRARKGESTPAKITLNMAYPVITPTWTSIPQPPKDTSALEILIKVDHMYHPVYMTHGPRNAILIAVFEVLKQYIHRGPHLSRLSALCQPLHLETVRITLAPPMPFEDMTFVYGLPAQQLDKLFNEFKTLMCRLGRSGVLFPSIDVFKVRMEGKEWEHIPVSSNIWDEADYVFFQHGGYKWDAGDPPIC